MSCQSSVPPTMWSRKIGKVGKPIVFNIGLLCSKTFDDSIFEELFWTKYGLAKADMTKMNIKGRSEEHTSEIQSLMRPSYDVFCLKQKKYYLHYTFIK